MTRADAKHITLTRLIDADAKLRAHIRANFLHQMSLHSPGTTLTEEQLNMVINGFIDPYVPPPPAPRSPVAWYMAGGHNELLVVHRGPPMPTGYVYAPYIPLVVGKMTPWKLRWRRFVRFLWAPVRRYRIRLREAELP